MKSTHVYAFDHGESNRKIKKQKKYQIPEMNAVKPARTTERQSRPNDRAEVTDFLIIGGIV